MSSNEHEKDLGLGRFKLEKNQRKRLGLEEIQTLERFRPKKVWTKEEQNKHRNGRDHQSSNKPNN